MNYYRNDRMDWFTNSTPLPRELDTTKGENKILKFIGTNIAEIDKKSFKGSITYFDSLCSQVKIAEKASSLRCNETANYTTWCFRLSNKYIYI